MVIRSLIIAVLLAGASSVHATPTSSNAGVLGGWTLQSGSVSVVGALNSIDAIVESGNWAAFSQAWSMHTSMASSETESGNLAVLFSPKAAGGMSTLGFASSAASVTGGAASGGGAGGTSGGDGGSIGGGGTLELTDIDANLNLDVVDGGVGAAQIPEPGSIALLLAGLAAAGFASRRRSR